MHEHSLIRNLVEKIQQLANEQHGKLVAAKLRLGALAHISAEHLQEHFQQETAGTPLEGLRLHIVEHSDVHHPEAQDIILDSLEFEARDEC